jgi:apolipoprotein N-acyltransferase
MAILKTKYSWLLTGILLGLSFPSYDPIPTGILAWFAFVPFLLANRENSSLKKFIVQSLLVFVVSTTINNWWVAIFSFKALLTCYLTQVPFMVTPFLVFYFVKKRWSWERAIIILPFVWTLNDWVLHTMPHGLQVYLLPYTQANNTWLIQFADIFGMWGVGFWVMMMNSLIALVAPLIVGRPAPKGGASSLPKLPLWGLGGCSFFPLIYSFYVYVLNPQSVLGLSNQKSKVSIIQTNLDSYSKDSLLAQKTFDQVISLSDSAVRTTKPDLIVLPEAAIPVPLFQDKNLFDFTRKVITAWQTSLAIGYVEYPDSTKKHVFRNNALIFTPQLAMFWDSLKIKPSDVKVYQKQYGLPFVELMPYFENTPTARGTAMQRGNEPYTFDYTNFNGDKFSVALTICWEQMYPHKMAALVNQNADFIALMNNDSWFGKTGGAKQLLSFTRMRAIENRRTIVRCSNGGISCFIDPYGKIYGKLPWFTANISTQEVLCVSKKSFYTQHPNFFLILVGLMLLFLIVLFELKKINKKPKKLIL